MPLFSVLWDIDIEADTPREAAEKALSIHRDPGSIATVFDVREHGKPCSVTIDLTEDCNEGKEE